MNRGGSPSHGRQGQGARSDGPGRLALRLLLVAGLHNDRFTIKLSQQDKSDLVAFLGSL